MAEKIRWEILNDRKRDYDGKVAFYGLSENEFKTHNDHKTNYKCSYNLSNKL